MAIMLCARSGAAQRARTRRFFLESLERRELMAGDAVITWNEHLNTVVQTDAGQMGPTRSSRAYGMVHVAIYDAVNAITKTHTPFAMVAHASPTASVEAAVAAAARNVINELYPAQQALVDGWYAEELALIPDGPDEDAGIALGEQAADLCIEMRGSDGSNAVKAYRANSQQGHWRPDPTILGTPQMALDPIWGKVKPFVINSTSDFPIPPPPRLNSPEYAAAFNEVKELGALNSATRTQDQTEIGLFWAYDRKFFGPPLVLYNENMQDIAETQGNTLEENARLFALGNIAMADAGIAIWDYKYRYDFWRPISGIREAASDGNPLTVADPNWVPLGAPGDPQNGVPDFTPPFPAYGSGHAGFGAALFQVLERFYGTDDVGYTLHSDEAGGLTRNYTSFSQAADENGRSRIYLGVHWEFDNVESQDQGRRIADFVFDKLFQPVGEGDTLISIRKAGGGMQTLSLASDANVVIKRSGAHIRIVSSADNSVLFACPVTTIEQISFDGRNGSSNNVTVDLGSGPLTIPFVIDVHGGAGDGDSVTVLGSGRAETLSLIGDELRMGAVAPIVSLDGVEQVSLIGRAGNDTLTVLGDQSGRAITLQGDAGNDIFRIGSTGAALTVIDSAGVELFDFSQATSAVEIDLCEHASQVQDDVAGNTLALSGVIENLDGSVHSDKLYGSSQGNRIRGLTGNDILRGEGGADTVDGGGGDDVVLGGAGTDQLFGGVGRDLLIGGLGVDTVNGQGDEDILVGGNTTHDGNEAALLNIMAEWTSTNSRTDRVNNLRNGSGGASGSNGGTFLDSASVLNDSAIDTLLFTTGDFILKFNNDRQVRS